MESLSWTGPPPERLLALPVDEELDHYRLLAYMQRIHAHYRERKLYPYLDDLRERLDQLTQLQRRKTELAQAMPRELSGFDLRTGSLMRVPLKQDDLLRTIDRMIAQALPELDRALAMGAELRDEIFHRIRFEPVGLLPLRTEEGYLILHQGGQARVYSYEFPLSAKALAHGGHQDVRTHYLADYPITFACTFEHVKADIVRHITALPNPAVFAFTVDLTLPAIETFVPLAKQIVYELVTNGVS